MSPGTSQKLPFNEVYTALGQGVVDGQENAWSNIYSKKFFEVQDYITESNHGLIDYLIVTSTEFWTGLPDDIRVEVKKALDEALEFGNKVAADKATQDRQKVVDSKRSEIITISDADRALWVEAMKPVWGKFEKEICKDLIDAAFASN